MYLKNVFTFINACFSRFFELIVATTLITVVSTTPITFFTSFIALVADLVCFIKKLRWCAIHSNLIEYFI